MIDSISTTLSHSLYALGLIFLAGILLDIWYLAEYLLQKISLPCHSSGSPVRDHSPFRRATVLLVLSVTLIPAVITFFSPDPESAPGARQLAGGIFSYTLLAFAVIFILNRIHLTRLAPGLSDIVFPLPMKRIAAIIRGVTYGIAVIPPVLLAGAIASYFATQWGLDVSPQKAFSYFVDLTYPAPLRFLLTLSAVALAPVYEEILFRGYLFPALWGKKITPWPAILVCGFLFALVHLHLVSFFPLFLLNIFLCMGYLRTGSILTPIIMHGIFNGTSLLIWSLLNG